MKECYVAMPIRLRVMSLTAPDIAGCLGTRWDMAWDCTFTRLRCFPPAAPQTLVLQEGDVVTVEPGIYLAGRFGVRIEDMITVQDHQVLDLTHSEKDLIVL